MMIIIRKLIFFVYCGGICNNRVQQFVNFGAPVKISALSRDFFIAKIIKYDNKTTSKFIIV